MFFLKYKYTRSISRHAVSRVRGAALIILVFFFITISIAIIQSATIGALSELRTYRSLATSKLSYVAAEAGIEDIFYRIITAKNIPTSETIVLNGATSTISVVDVASTEKAIWATGNASNQIRRLYMNTSKNANVQFPYGAQVGEGGIIMSNNTSIDGIGLANGDLYSNGSITGSNGAVVTGNVFSASSVVADETASSTVCLTDELVGRSNPKIDFAQSFVISTTTTSADLFKVSLYIKRFSNPTGANIRITADNAGAPATTALATQALSYSAVSTSYGWVDVIFTTPPMLNPGTTYWIVFDSTQDASKYWYWCRSNSDTYSNGSSAYKQVWTSALSWTALAGDLAFRVYLGGGVSQIDDVEVRGLAKADTIKNSDVTGNAYYQSLISTVVGGTSYPGSPTPPPVPLPITPATILQWKADATSGGVIVGNCGTGGDPACNTFPLSLGPKQITGNLRVENSVALTVTGTLYVKGNVTFDNNTITRCAAAFLGNSCIIIADGYIQLGNNSIFAGSGTAGSFIMLLSTKVGCLGVATTTCAANNSAISIQNNVGGALFYTSDSLIDISNNATVTAIVGYMIKMQNGTAINYDPAVANISFAPASSGVTGAWNAIRWNEY